MGLLYLLPFTLGRGFQVPVPYVVGMCLSLLSFFHFVHPFLYFRILSFLFTAVFVTFILFSVLFS